MTQQLSGIPYRNVDTFNYVIYIISQSNQFFTPDQFWPSGLVVVYICLSVCPSVQLSICLSVHPSVYRWNGFHSVSSTILARLSFSVRLSVCSKKGDLLERVKSLTKKLLQKHYTINGLKSSVKKCLKEHRWITTKLGPRLHQNLTEE